MLLDTINIVTSHFYFYKIIKNLKFMAFIPGQSGNPAGMKKGFKKQKKISINQAVTDTFKTLQTDENTKLENWAKNNPSHFYLLAAIIQPANSRESLVKNMPVFSNVM